MNNFSGIVAWYSANRIPGILSFSSDISISLIFILNGKIALVFETEMLNWTANEESLGRVGRFFIYSRFVVAATGDFVYAKFSEVNVMNYSTFLLFSRSSVMILLVFLVSLFFFFVKDQIASFQLKQIIVLCSVCVFISLRDCDRVCL